LTHRYSFDTNAMDLVGTAHGALQGRAAINQGAVVLDGTNSSVWLPDNLFTNYSALSIEIWFMDLGANVEVPLYYFGGTNGFIGCLATGLGTYTSISNALTQTARMPMPIPGVTNHLVWTQSLAAKKASLYLNGVLVGQNTNFTLSPAMVGRTTTNLIGAGGIPSTCFAGRVFELRTFDTALSALEVAQLDAAGAGQPSPVPGGLQAVRLTVPVALGPGALVTPGVFADYDNLTNVNLISQTELGLSSDNASTVAAALVTNQVFPFRYSSPTTTPSAYTNVALQTTSLRWRTFGSGTAHLTASYQGLSNQVAVSVQSPSAPVLIHRYSFNEEAGTLVAHDSIGAAHGRVIAGAGLSTFTGAGELWVGQGTTNPSYVQLPAGLVSCESEVSIETWLTYQAPTLAWYWTGWARVFDFGDQAGGYGNTYFFVTPRNDSLLTRLAVSKGGIAGETPILDWTDGIGQNVTSHVAVAYSPARGLSKLWINGGAPITGTATAALALIKDMNNWLGRSQFSEDPYLKGRYDEFRIYRGVLSDSDIAADYAAGPEVVRDFVIQTGVSGTDLLLSWGPSAGDWLLETSSELGAAAAWNPAPSTPVPQGGRMVATVPAGNSQAFFRLRKP
jgi:hypothetical protein